MVVKCMENDTGRVFEKFFTYMEKALAFIQQVLSFYKL